MGSVLKVMYGGTSASCLIEADAPEKTLTAKVGEPGSEIADPGFGSGGVIDLSTDASTLSALVKLINGFDDYSAEKYSGDNSADPETILDASVQAAGVAAYLLFSPASVLSPYALVSWERAQEMLNYPDTDQTLVERLINAVTIAAEGSQYAGRKLVARGYDLYLPGNGRDSLILSSPPINAITALYVDASREFGDDALIPENEYDLDREAGIVYLLNGWFPEGRKVIRIVYNGGYGYDDEDVPDDLQIATLEAVSWNVARFRSPSFGVRTTSAPNGLESTMELTIPVSAQRVFESYRSWRNA